MGLFDSGTNKKVGVLERGLIERGLIEGGLIEGCLLELLRYICFKFLTLFSPLISGSYNVQKQFEAKKRYL